MKSLERTFTTWDGQELFYRAWLPEINAETISSRARVSMPNRLPRIRKALLLFHRGHEHSGRWQETVEALGLRDVAIFAWDARGHGRSPGERGSAENLSVIIRDVDAFVRHISEEYRIAVEDIIVLAHSVGAVAVTAWVHDYVPPIRAMILATPAFRVKLYVPFAIPFLRLKQKLFGHGYVNSYVKAKLLTHDPDQAAKYAADELIFRQIAVNILLDLHDTSSRLRADAGAIRVPTLILVAESDWVVKLSAQKKFFESLGSTIKQMEVLPGFSHAIFHERDRSRVIDRVRQFCEERFQAGHENSSLIEADRHGYTKAEYDRLCRPAGAWLRLMKLGTKIGGLFSHGIKLGWQSGFDSGRTLDYVYQNRPRGRMLIGRFIDKVYLESIGWRGIRRRKVHLEKMLREAVQRLQVTGRSVRVLDIASGPGRYVLEVLRSLPKIPITAVLRDYKLENVQAAAQLSKEFGLNGVTAKLGDAFDRASIAAVNPKPTIGIVSGLYELFPANQPVRDSLRGLADAIEPGGYLIYTNQPWHPQIEFIARVLTNREGQPWIMRRRTTEEMDQLVRAAGFEKIAMEIDQWGIFTVSLARRTGRHCEPAFSVIADHESGIPDVRTRQPKEELCPYAAAHVAP